jgi:hypothetical protein
VVLAQIPHHVLVMGLIGPPTNLQKLRIPPQALHLHRHSTQIRERRVLASTRSQGRHQAQTTPTRQGTHPHPLNGQTTSPAHSQRPYAHGASQLAGFEGAPGTRRRSHSRPAPGWRCPPPPCPSAHTTRHETPQHSALSTPQHNPEELPPLSITLYHPTKPSPR